MNTLPSFQIIYCPSIIVAGKPFSVTIKTSAPVSLNIDSPIVKPYNNAAFSFETAGIYSLKLICDRIINDFSFDIECRDQKETLNILRSLEKPFDDNIGLYFEENSDAPAIDANFSSVRLACAKMRGENKERFAFCFNKDSLDKSDENLLQYLAYMSGASDFYLDSESDFYKFALSHTRCGKYNAPIAFVADENGQTESFAETMLSLCPTADIIDIKGSQIENYKAICLISKKKLSKDEAADLLAFIHTGGTLICSSNSLSEENTKLSEYIFSDKFSVTEDSYCGFPIKIFPNVKFDDIIATSDSGFPLAFLRRIGLGQIFFINSTNAPDENGVKPLYQAIISEIRDNLNAEEKIYITADKEIAFTAYNQQDNAKHLYLLVLDDSKKHSASLKINRNKYKIEVPFGSMIKIVAKDDVAVWSEDEKVEVLLITHDVVTLQGYRKTTIKFAKNGEVTEREIDFTKKPIQAIQI